MVQVNRTPYEADLFIGLLLVVQVRMALLFVVVCDLIVNTWYIVVGNQYISGHTLNVTHLCSAILLPYSV